MLTRKYRAVLDVYALIATYPTQAEVLASYTEYTALCYLQNKVQKRELITLLRLAKDLGYKSDELYQAHLQYFM
jgi:hypothetical protein